MAEPFPAICRGTGAGADGRERPGHDDETASSGMKRGAVAPARRMG
jgi:hypothetical protein